MPPITEEQRRAFEKARNEALIRARQQKLQTPQTMPASRAQRQAARQTEQRRREKALDILRGFVPSVTPLEKTMKGVAKVETRKKPKDRR